jgi:hypothetical protein
MSLRFRTVDRGELAADQYFAIRLKDECRNVPVRSGAGIKSVVQTAVGIEPRNSAAARPIHIGEAADDKDFAVRL